MINKKMVIGERYDVAYGLTPDWELETAEMVLKEIQYHDEKEIYIFHNKSAPVSSTFVTYNHNGEIDWEFMEEIDFIFN